MRFRNIAGAFAVIAGFATDQLFLPNLSVAAMAVRVGAVSKVRTMADISTRGATSAADVVTINF